MIDKQHYHEEALVQRVMLTKEQRLELRRILGNKPREDQFWTVAKGIRRAAEFQQSILRSDNDIYFRLVEIGKLLAKVNHLMDGMGPDESVLDQYLYLATKNLSLLNPRSHPFGGSETSYLLDGIANALAIAKDDYEPKSKGGPKKSFEYTYPIELLGKYFLKAYPNRKISSGENSVFRKLVEFYFSSILGRPGLSAKNEIEKLKKAQNS